jgi:hypothetical protein
MAYVRSKLTRMGQPCDTVAVSPDMEIPRTVLKRRGAISLEGPNEQMLLARDFAAPSTKRPRRSPSAGSERTQP